MSSFTSKALACKDSQSTLGKEEKLQPFQLIECHRLAGLIVLKTKIKELILYLKERIANKKDLKTDRLESNNFT